MRNGPRGPRGIALVVLWLGALGTSLHAEPWAFDGELELRVGSLPPLSIAGTGVANLEESSGGSGLSTITLVGGISGSDILPITDPLVTGAGLMELQASVALGSGSLGPITSVLQNSLLALTRRTLPVAGEVRICVLVSGCGSVIALPLTSNGTRGFGLGGAPLFGSLGGLKVSVQGAPWTVKTVTLLHRTAGGGITYPNARGFAHGPASLTSSVSNPSGVLQLVTPMQVTTTGFPPNNDLIALFGVLRLRFIPEPNVPLLLASGVAALAGLHRLRRGRYG